MVIIQLKNRNTIPARIRFRRFGPVEIPIGDLVSELSGKILCENKDGSKAGIWECTAGKWTRQVMDAELSVFLKGKDIFYPENGDPISIDSWRPSIFRCE